MARLLSCTFTIPEVKARTKTVTRRAENTWRSLAVGDSLLLVERTRGLPKGSHVVPLATVVVTSIRVERLYDITDEEVALEGFPGMDRFEFIEWWLDTHNVPVFADQTEAMAFRVRRIEWAYRPRRRR